MNLGSLIERLLGHYAPEERSIPNDPEYPGRVDSAMAAVNAALQFLFGSQASWTRRGSKGFLLHGPATATATVTYGSDVIDFAEAWQDRFEGCAIRITGASFENRIHGIDADTGIVTLVSPHDGETGEATCTVYQDSITLPAEISEVLAPVCIKGDVFLTAVPSVTQLPYHADVWEDYGMENQVTARPQVQDIGASLGTPRRYCVDTHQQHSSSMPAHRLRIFPAPASPAMLEARIRFAVPIFTSIDDFATELPIPHQYCESILVPVAEKHLTRSPFFRDDAARAGIDEAYGHAVLMLKSLNPQASAGRRFLYPY